MDTPHPNLLGSPRDSMPSALGSVARWPIGKASDAVGQAAKLVRERLLNGPDITGPGIMVRHVFYPVRTLVADDTEVLRRFLQEDLSDESRNRRFFSPMPTVPATAAAWLANRDGRDRMALAALDPNDLTHIVALVEYALVPDGPPEVAIAVADAYQGQGIGSNVLRMMATMSLAAGEPNWQCSMLANNDAPLRVLASVGDVEQIGITGAVRSVTVHLDPSRLLGTTIPV